MRATNIIVHCARSFFGKTHPGGGVYETWDLRQVGRLHRARSTAELQGGARHAARGAALGERTRAARGPPRLWAFLDSLPAACSVRTAHASVTMDVMDIAVKPVKEFAKDSYRLVKRCTKPDRKGAPELQTMVARTIYCTAPVLWARAPRLAAVDQARLVRRCGGPCPAMRRLCAHRRTRAAKRDAVDGRRCVRLRSALACHASRQPSCTPHVSEQCALCLDA